MSDESSQPRWQPLSTNQRRVLGVLIEKAKTTPENYPLSLNAIRVGANQKSNRSPQMQLDEGGVQEALDELRDLGAVAVIQGDGRVEKFRHLAYDWLGVEKVELSVMAELLLRGDQTVGELRGRATRMDPIPGLSELKPLLASLKEKGLIVYLTPEGRGCTVTHSLYLPQQMDKLRTEYGTSEATDAGGESKPARAASCSSAAALPATAAPPASDAGASVELRQQVADLQQQVSELKQEVAEIAALVRSNAAE